MNSTTNDTAARNDATEQPAKQESFDFPVSNEIFLNCERMGNALSLYLWYIDKTTKEYEDPDGTTIGRVWRGVPCCDSHPARALGVTERTIRKRRKHLEDQHFIRTKQTGHGPKVEVINSRKYAWKKRKADRKVHAAQTGANVPTRPERPFRPDRNECSGPLDSTGTVRGQNIKSATATAVAAARDYAFTSYQSKFAERPNWTVKDYAQLKGLFSRKGDLTINEFRRRWDHYLNSKNAFYSGAGFSLALFCCKTFDALRDGPQNDRGQESVEKPYGGLTRKELERKRNEITPEAKKLYDKIGVRPV